MRRLVAAEYRKLFKSKLTLILLVLLALFTGNMANRIYQDPAINLARGLSTSWEFRDMEGNQIAQGIAYARYADEFHHSFAGEITPELNKRYQQLYQQMLQDYAENVLDDSAMKQVYGADYFAVMEKIDGKEFSKEEFSDLQTKYPYLTIKQEEADLGQLEFPIVYYEHDHTRFLYRAMYSTYHDGGRFSAEDLNPTLAVNILQSDNYQWLDRTGNEEMVLRLLPSDTLRKHDSVIGSNLFLDSSKMINFMTLIVLIMLLANSYAMEHATKADQIIVSSCKGNHHTMLAKLIMAATFGVDVVLMQYLVVFAISCYSLPMRDLSMLAMPQAGTYLGNISPYIFTYAEIIGTQMILQSVAAMATAILTLCCSYFTKNRFAAATILFVFVIGTYYLALLETREHAFSSFISLGTMMEIEQYFSLTSFQQTFPYVMLGDVMISWKLIACLLWGAVMLLFSTLLYAHSKRHQVSTS